MPFIPSTASSKIIELLAPAKNISTAVTAINSGADAVYMGASDFGARKMASNSIEDIQKVVEFAHIFGARVYVTVNTIIYEEELKTVEKLVWDLWRIGVDALIVQDMGLLEMDLPPIALHASTQCDIRTPEKARFLEECGFSQLVLPRELSLMEIREFRALTNVPLEAFVHGALCVSYSGDCQASYVLTGRSANRGECAQICRYIFDLENEKGEKIISGRHFLSLKDMNRLDYLEDMLDAGITSFKIEGRLKDEGYVKNVVAAYSQVLDSIVLRSHGQYVRRARGHALVGFDPDVTKSFNRDFTSYFLKNTQPNKYELSSSRTPKWIGEPIATVERCINNRSAKIRQTKPLNNGDGLGYFNVKGEFCGFRLNRIEGNIIHSATAIEVERGMTLYRNSNKEWNETMEKSKAKRLIEIDMTLRICGNILVVEVVDSDGIGVSCSRDLPQLQMAKTPQEEGRRRTLAKLGETIFKLRHFVDETGTIFIPMSVLADLRREVLSALEHAYLMRMPLDLRRSSKINGLRSCYKPQLTRHDNIANSYAKRFYEKKTSGAVCAEALEVSRKGLDSDYRIMQTRYCLRRELGACLKSDKGRMLPDKLYLSSGKSRFLLEFDCSTCKMNVLLERK